MHPTLNPRAGSAPQQGPATQRTPSRRTQDSATRMFHWLLALSFVGAYATAESERWRAMHVTLGYTLALLLVFRLIWGAVGPRHVRWSALGRRLQGLGPWLLSWRTKAVAPANGVKEAALAASAWSQVGIQLRQGAALLLALGVLLLLVTIVPLVISGWMTYNEWGGEWLGEVHEFFGNSLLMLALLHLVLIAALTAVRGKSQITPMLTGRTAGSGPDLVKSSYTWVAALLLVCVLVLWVWQWDSAPKGLLPIAGSAGQLTDSDHDRDDD